MTRPSKYSNNLRADLYSLLFPEIIREDHEAGPQTYINFHDDPLREWDSGTLWDELGVLPVIKNAFYGIEKEEVKDLELIDDISTLSDPDRCPEKFLDYMASSLGHPLEDGLSTDRKREVIKSVAQLQKMRGKELSWKVFFRLLGFQINAIPLFKRDVFEENDQYSPTRYTTETKSETIGTAGAQDYVTYLTHPPVMPGSLRITVDGKTFRDNDNKMSNDYGTLITPDSSTGTVNYATGKITLSLPAPSGTNVEAEYEQITEEFPYKAARVDLEFFIFLDEEDPPAVSTELLDKILKRLDEVRPIHVVVRLLVIVLDVPDIVEDFASDSRRCGPTMGKDVRGSEYRFYMADLGPGASDDHFVLEEDGVSVEDTLVLDESYDVAANPDTLVIEFSNGQPTQYW